jgi:glycosyltransferase involved in cell wall biosynthesis
VKNNASKTLLLVTPYFPPHPGGLEKYAEALALRLAKSFYWRVVVITSSDEGRDSKEVTNGLTIYRLKPLFKLSNTPFSPNWVFKIRRIIKAEKPDVINAHSPVPGMADASAVAAGKIPFVVTYHSGSMKKGSTLIDLALGAYEKIILPRILGRANKIISSSEFLRTGFLNEYQRKITTISPGVDVTFFTPKESVPANILFVGDHSKAARYKGLDFLLEALAIVRKKVLGATLAVIGPSDDLDFYRQRCNELKIVDAVRFLGSMGEERVREFQRAAVFALPTSNDNFPMVIAEALSCGVPVVSTPIGNIPLMVEDGKNGYLVPTKNAIALSGALEKLLSDGELRQRFGQAARLKAQAELSWDSRVAATDKLFLQLIAEKSPVEIFQVSAYFPPHIGGVEQVVKSLSEKLLARGHKVTVITSNSVEGRTVVRQNHVKFLRSFEIAHTPFAPTLFWHLLKIKKRDVVHLHVAQAYFADLAWLASKVKQFSYIAHFHLDVQPSGSLGFLFKFYKRTLLGLIMRSAKKVVVFSEPQKLLVSRQYRVNPNNIIIIPNGVSEGFFLSSASRNSSYNDRRTPRVLYVGRMVRAQKHVERIVESAPLLSHKAEFDLVGDGEDRLELESLAKNLQVTNVHFHGAKDRKALMSFYARSDLFVLPSDQEGMPLALLEAMATGLPIIGSDVMGIRELINDCGVLVAPSPRNFASAIDKVISNTQLAGNLSRKSFIKGREFSWDNLVGKFENLYGSE